MNLKGLIAACSWLASKGCSRLFFRELQVAMEIGGGLIVGTLQLNIV